MNIIIILVIIIIIFYLLNVSKEYDPSQSEIQSLDYAINKELLKTKDFVYPQISYGFKKLGKDLLVKPLNNLDKLLPKNEPEINIIRDTTETMNTERLYLPDYYRKDRLTENNIGSSELRQFNKNDEESDKAWTDVSVSRHPKFYTSEIKNELTNIGMFFDKNNQYHDKTSENTNVLPSDKCYIDKFGNNYCEDNTRLQNIPPSLITDIKKCEVLNTIGSHKDKMYNSKHISNYHVDDFKGESHVVSMYDDDRVINGGKYYNEIYPSLKQNENYGSPLKPLCDECFI